jgi:Na+/alanine symporter
MDADPATAGLDGVLLTGAAFGEALSDIAQYLLSFAVVLFAFSTMISWSYYGERCWAFLFGAEQTFPYRILFCGFVWLGCVSSLGNVLDFSDLMILSMAFPNFVGVVIEASACAVLTRCDPIDRVGGFGGIRRGLSWQRECYTRGTDAYDCDANPDVPRVCRRF